MTTTLESCIKLLYPRVTSDLLPQYRHEAKMYVTDQKDMHEGDIGISVIYHETKEPQVIVSVPDAFCVISRGRSKYRLRRTVDAPTQVKVNETQDKVNETLETHAETPMLNLQGHAVDIFQMAYGLNGKSRCCSHEWLISHYEKVCGCSKQAIMAVIYGRWFHEQLKVWRSLVPGYTPVPSHVFASLDVTKLPFYNYDANKVSVMKPLETHDADKVNDKKSNGKLEHVAVKIFQMAYGLFKFPRYDHEDLIAHCKCLFHCSGLSLYTLLYGRSYNTLLEEWRAQVTGYEPVAHFGKKFNPKKLPFYNHNKDAVWPNGKPKCCACWELTDQFYCCLRQSKTTATQPKTVAATQPKTVAATQPKTVAATQPKTVAQVKPSQDVPIIFENFHCSPRHTAEPKTSSQDVRFIDQVKQDSSTKDPSAKDSSARIPEDPSTTIQAQIEQCSNKRTTRAKLEDDAKRIFKLAYGLKGHLRMNHDELITNAMQICGCSKAAVQALLYGSLCFF